LSDCQTRLFRDKKLSIQEFDLFLSNIEFCK